MDVDLEDTKVLRLQATTKIEGVVLPQWLAVAVGAILVSLTFVIGLVYQQQRQMLRAMEARDKLIEREYRVFQQHLIDVENVLVRQGIATREDLTPWRQPEAPKKEE